MGPGHTHTHTCTHIHTLMHTHAHTHIRTYAVLLSLPFLEARGRHKGRRHHSTFHRAAALETPHYNVAASRQMCAKKNKGVWSVLEPKRVGRAGVCARAKVGVFRVRRAQRFK